MQVLKSFYVKKISVDALRSFGIDLWFHDNLQSVMKENGDFLFLDSYTFLPSIR